MGANIEVKARSRDWDRQHVKAQRLAGKRPILIEQVDTFFHVPTGHLKLREFTPERGELIYYQRPDQPGPKLSEYSITPTSNPASLCETLAQALGVSAELRKRRWLFLSNEPGALTRIHFDEVRGLGRFIELEVVLAPGQPTEEGEEIARRFCAALDIRDEDLIDCAYVDLMASQGCGP
jgi:adenylate cyclase class IV